MSVLKERAQSSCQSHITKITEKQGAGLQAPHVGQRAGNVPRLRQPATDFQQALLTGGYQGTLAAKVLAATGDVETVQVILGLAQLDHSRI